jgi:transcriptional regulator with XRE-family HTH domain
MTIIRNRRIQLGTSQKDLARKAGIDARTLRKIESGEHVSAVSLNAVERVLGIGAQTSDIERGGRQNLFPLRKFQFIVGLFYTTVFAMIAVFAFNGSSNIILATPIAIMSFPLVAVFYWAFVVPSRGNTRIEIRASLSKAENLADPLNKVKGWLGRQDVTIEKVRVEGSDFKLVAYVDYDFHEYPAVIQKLNGFGVEAMIGTTA